MLELEKVQDKLSSLFASSQVAHLITLPCVVIIPRSVSLSSQTHMADTITQLIHQQALQCNKVNIVQLITMANRIYVDLWSFIKTDLENIAEQLIITSFTSSEFYTCIRAMHATLSSLHSASCVNLESILLNAEHISRTCTFKTEVFRAKDHQLNEILKNLTLPISALMGEKDLVYQIFDFYHKLCDIINHSMQMINDLQKIVQHNTYLLTVLKLYSKSFSDILTTVIPSDHTLKSQELELAKPHKLLQQELAKDPSIAHQLLKTMKHIQDLTLQIPKSKETYFANKQSLLAKTYHISKKLSEIVMYFIENPELKFQSPFDGQQRTLQIIPSLYHVELLPVSGSSRVTFWTVTPIGRPHLYNTPRANSFPSQKRKEREYAHQQLPTVPPQKCPRLTPADDKSSAPGLLLLASVAADMEKLPIPSTPVPKEK